MRDPKTIYYHLGCIQGALEMFTSVSEQYKEPSPDSGIHNALYDILDALNRASTELEKLLDKHCS